MKNLLLVSILLLLINQGFAQAPVITSFVPLTAPAGATVTINGDNFNTTASNNLVFFGFIKATVTSASTTQIVIKVPVGAAYGPVSVLNTANFLTGYSSVSFLTSFATPVNDNSVIDFDPETTLENYEVYDENHVSTLTDIDGDGKSDILFTSPNHSQITIYKNLLTGKLKPSSFAPKVTISAGMNTYSVVSADVNGDGKLDIIYANGGKRIGILLNNYTGGVISQSSFTSITINSTVITRIVQISDIDADGRPDILTSNARDSVSIFRNASVNGVVTAASFAGFNMKIKTVLNQYYQSVKLQDLNADGRPEMIIGKSGDKKVSIFKNIGNPGALNAASFAVEKEFSVNSVFWPPILADIDGDGKSDIVVPYLIDQKKAIAILRNTTTSPDLAVSFATAVDIPIAEYFLSVAVADFDGNGKPDLAGATYSTYDGTNRISVLRNTATPGNILTSSFNNKQDFYSTSTSAILNIGDMDNDGMSDIVAAGAGLSILRNNPLATPVVTDFNNRVDSIGATLRLEGKGFSRNNANNIVHFGATRAVVTESGFQRVKVVVPTGAAYGPISILNTEKNRSANSMGPFTPTFPSKNEIIADDLSEQVNLATGAKPAVTVLKDLDGDGKIDMVAGYSTGGNVYVFRNISVNGQLTAASFAAGVPFAVGTGASDICVSDIDNDGKLDIVVSNFTGNTVSVLRNTSTSGSIAASSFAAKTDFATGINPVKVAAGDIDRDGRPEIVVVNNGSNSISILRNTTAGGAISVPSFAAKVDFAVGIKPSSIAVGHVVDGDTGVDIVVTNSGSNTISIFKNLGILNELTSASLAPRVDLAAGANPSAVAIAVGPSALQIGLGIVVANKGDNTFSIFTAINYVNEHTPDTRINFAAGQSPADLEIADFDGDGALDIGIVNEGDNTFSIFRNIISVYATNLNEIKFAPRIDVPVNGTPAAVSFADLDQDKKPDIVVANNTGNALVLIHNKRIINPVAITAFTPATGPAGTEVTITGKNFNTKASKNIVFFGAVKAEVVSATATALKVKAPVGATYLPISVLNTGNKLTAFSLKPFVTTFENFNNVRTVDFDARISIQHPAYDHKICDVDGDGKPDLIIAGGGTYSSNYYNAIYRNISAKGDLKESSFESIAPEPFTQARDERNMVIDDINADGKPDILMPAGDSFYYHLNVAAPGSISPLFSDRRTASVNVEKQMKLGDIDGDGKIDIVAATYASSLRIFRNVSTSSEVSFAAVTGITLPNNYDDVWVDLGDIDGDGKTDIVLTNRTKATISIYRNITIPGGAVAFAPKIDVNGNNGVSSTALADVDGDGRLDIIIGHINIPNISNAFVSVYKNIYEKGKADVFAPRVDYLLPAPSAYGLILAVTVADMTGDGKVDIIATAGYTPGNNGNNSSKSFILTNKISGGTISAGSFADESEAITGLNTNVVSAGDLDGDSRPDLVTVYNNGVYVMRSNPVKPPSITSITPLSANKGTDITINGSGFDAVAANNIVYFGAVRATVTQAAEATLVVKSPVGATYKPVSVLNTVKKLTGYSSRPFNTTFLSKYDIEKDDLKLKLKVPTSKLPQGTAIGDLDGDGKPDIVVANSGSASISVYHNTYAGGSKINFTTGEGPRNVAIGDLDGDGKPDIAVANATGNTISVFRNTSSGGSITSSSFAAKVDFAAGESPVDVVIADIDKDGRPDLVAANSGNNTVSVFKNTSQRGSITTASFKSKIDFTTGKRPISVCAADIDGDEKADLITANYDGKSISVLQNAAVSNEISVSAFLAKIDFATGINPVKVNVTDFGSGERPEIIVVNKGGNTLSVFKNDAFPGYFNAASLSVFTTINTGDQPSGLATADIDGDGKPDLVLTNSGSNTVSVYRNISTYQNTIAFAPKVDFATGKKPLALSVGDMTGDDKPDIIVSNYDDNTLSVLGNNPVIWPPVITSFSPEKGPIGTVVTIKGTGFDADAANNVVFFGTAKASIMVATPTMLMVTVPAGTSYQPVSVLNRKKTLTGYSALPFIATFTASKPGIDPKVNFAAGKAPMAIQLADIDADGKIDMIAGNSTDNTVSVFRNVSTVKRVINSATFAPKVNFVTGASPSAIAVADFNGDGTADMVVTNSTGNSVSVLHNTGGAANTTSLFTAKTDYAAGTVPSSVIAQDINADGKPDIIVANSGSSTLSIFKNTSVDGIISFAKKVDYATGANPASVSIGDINNDGKPDLITADYGSNTISIFPNTTDLLTRNVSFSPKISFAAGTKPQCIALGDINADGKPDIISVNKGSNSISVFRNAYTTGNITSASLAPKKDLPAGSGPEYVVISDVNGDGKADIVVANKAGKSLSVLANLTSGNSVAFNNKMDLPAGSSPQAIAAGDIDGDGMPDIAMANLGENTLSAIRNSPALPQAPVITSFSPANGPVGTTLIIKGKNFNTSAAKNKMFFGSTAAVVTDATATQLTVTVPAGATHQPIAVLNTAEGVKGYSSLAFNTTYSNGKKNLTEADFDPMFSLGTTPYSSVDVGDINGDGKTDIVACDNNSGFVTFFINISLSGTFNKSSFSGGYPLYAGYGVRDVTLDDFDGDGKHDIIFLCEGSRKFSVMRNTTTDPNFASFATKVDFELGRLADRFTTGDINSDGKPDVIIGYGPDGSDNGKTDIFRNVAIKGSISVYSFEAGVDFANMQYGTLLGDADNDGKADLVAGSGNKSTVYKNNSTGNITPTIFSTAADLTGVYGRDFRLADIDGDGKNDLAVLSNTGSFVSIYRNISAANGLLSYASRVDIPFNQYVYALHIADINGDGKPDIVATHAFSASIVLNRTTPGSITAALFAPPVPCVTSFTSDIAIGDMDGDGKPDLVASRNIDIIRNNPDYNIPLITSFSPAKGPVGTVVTIHGENFNETIAGNIVKFGAVRATVKTATTSVLTVEAPAGFTYEQITVLNTTKGLSDQSKIPFNTTFGTVTPAFKSKVDFKTNVNPDSLCVSDIDGDGKPDIAVVNYNSNNVSVFRNISTTGSTGKLSMAAKVDFATGIKPTSVALGDIDGDGKPEMIVSSFESRTIAVYYNKSVTGTIDTASFGKPLILNTGSPIGVRIMDMDGDGRSDIVSSTKSYDWGNIAIIRNLSVPGSIITSPYNYGVGYTEKAAATIMADITGDGKPDILTVSGNNYLSVYQNTFTMGSFFGLTNLIRFDTGINPQSVAAGDIDGDGKLDVVTANKGSNSISIFRNTGTAAELSAGTLAPKVDIATASEPVYIAIGDVNGDGKADLLVANKGANNVTVYYNNSVPGTITASSFTQKADLATGSGPQSANIADMDGDGRSDILVANYDSNTISVICGNNIAGAAAISTENSTAVTISQAVSPNGDGINDALIIDGIIAYPDNKLYIIDAAGTLVFEASGYDNSSKVFKGNDSNGKRLKPGTYFYKLDYKDNDKLKQKTGYIVLKF